MTDERQPFRISRERARALAAAGIDNASTESQFLDRITRGVISVDDVVHLSPVSFAPRWVLNVVNLTPVNRATFQLVGTVPWKWDGGYLGNQTAFVRFATVPIAGGGALPAEAAINNPAPNLAPSSLTVTYVDTVTAISTAPSGVYEPNIAHRPEFLVEPGVIMQIQSNAAAATIQWQFLIQEYPGGVNERN